MSSHSLQPSRKKTALLVYSLAWPRSSSARSARLDSSPCSMRVRRAVIDSVCRRSCTRSRSSDAYFIVQMPHRIAPSCEKYATNDQSSKVLMAFSVYQRGGRKETHPGLRPPLQGGDRGNRLWRREREAGGGKWCGTRKKERGSPLSFLVTRGSKPGGR